MANVLIQESTMTAIADAIRDKKGVTDKYKPADMPAAIESITGGGSDIDLVPLDVTQNGLYIPEDGTAYSSVNVNVSGGGGGSLTLQSIDVKTRPLKTSYIVGEIFNPTGMIVSANFLILDEEEQIIVSGNISDYSYKKTPLTVEDNNIQIYYTYAGVTVTTNTPISVSGTTIKPIIGPNFLGTVNRTSVTSINFVPNFSHPSPSSYWDASYNRDGSIAGFLIGTDVYITWNDIEYKKLYFTSNISSMFSGFTNVTSLDLKLINTANVTDMSSLFFNSKKLVSVDLSSFNTSNVTNMGAMFRDCGIQSIDVSMFDTHNVTAMNAMFSTTPLVSVDLSSFDTSNVTNMNNMFQNSQQLTDLDLSSFNTSKVTAMANLFSGCTALKSVDISSFNTKGVTSMSNMFYSCSKLQTVKFPTITTNTIVPKNTSMPTTSNIYVPDEELTAYKTTTSPDFAATASQYYAYSDMPSVS